MTFINGMGEQVFGSSTEDIKAGLYVIQMFAPEDRGRAARVLSRWLAGEEPGGEELNLMDRDGSTFPALIYANGIRQDGVIAGVRGIVVDISDRKRAEDMLQDTAAELDDERESLKEKNIALRQVLSHIETERQDFKQRITKDVQHVVDDFVARLTQTCPPEMLSKLDQLSGEINSLLDKNIDAYQDRYEQLTPRELQICDMIRDGLSSKQIAENVNLSLYTVHKHREQIRKKLSITNKNVNLGTFLRSHRPSGRHT
jgi:PAS domain S-box-containing protein